VTLSVEENTTGVFSSSTSSSRPNPLLVGVIGSKSSRSIVDGDEIELRAEIDGRGASANETLFPEGAGRPAEEEYLRRELVWVASAEEEEAIPVF
jgi:hypothetical protein